MSKLDMPLRKVRKNIRAQCSLMYGFGTGQVLLTITPPLSLVAVPTGVIASTKLYLEQCWMDTDLHSDALRLGDARHTSSIGIPGKRNFCRKLFAKYRR